MSKLNIWTVDEYYENMKKYFSSKEEKKNKVIKIIYPWSWGGGYHYWIDLSLMPFEKQVDIWWNYEPLMHRYFGSKEELAEGMNPELKNAHGFDVRWLFHGNIVYQILAITGDVNSCIDNLRKNQDEDYLLGLRLDPFVYTGKLPIKIEDDGSGRKYIDKESPDLKVTENYSVFWEEITPEQFLQEEKLYTDENTHDTYSDDLVTNYKMNKEIEEFFRKHTKFRDEED